MEELENVYILFDGLMQLLRKPIHLKKFMSMGLRSILCLFQVLEDQVCD